MSFGKFARERCVLALCCLAVTNGVALPPAIY
jgi:hypothetical protein